MTQIKKVLTGTSGALLLSATLTTSLPAHSDDAGAFVGGMMASRVLNNMHRRTEAEEQQAAAAQQQAAQPVQQAAPAPTTQTVEQKLDQLNKLAAGGYISPEEYKAQKQRILNSM